MISSRSFFCLLSKYGRIKSRRTRAQRKARRACMGLSRFQISKNKRRNHHRQTTTARPINIHKTNCNNNFNFELVMAAPCSLPCISVAANPNGTGELSFESWESTESAREDEIKKAPQLAEVVLDWGSCKDQTVYRPYLLADESHLHNTHTKTTGFGGYSSTLQLPTVRFDCTRCERKNKPKLRVAPTCPHLCVRVADALSLVQNAVVPVARQKERLERLHPLVRCHHDNIRQAENSTYQSSQFSCSERKRATQNLERYVRRVK